MEITSVSASQRLTARTKHGIMNGRFGNDHERQLYEVVG